MLLNTLVPLLALSTLLTVLSFSVFGPRRVHRAEAKAEVGASSRATTGRPVGRELSTR